MNKELILRIAVGLAIAITLYATYLRGKDDAQSTKIGGIHKAMGVVIYTALDSFKISERDIFVPGYQDEERNALAVDAEKYKGSFAAADQVFNYPSGMYDLVLTTLKERAGESSYKILVDQKTWAFFKNDTTGTDYTLQEHRVDNVYIAEGEVLQVQFNSHANKRIPEGDGFAFSRGRWQSLKVMAAEK